VAISADKILVEILIPMNILGLPQFNMISYLLLVALVSIIL
jgi:hypothetical protein